MFRLRKEDIQNITLVEEDYLSDVYKEALAVQERRSVPVVGPGVCRPASFPEHFGGLQRRQAPIANMLRLCAGLPQHWRLNI